MVESNRKVRAAFQCVSIVPYAKCVEVEFSAVTDDKMWKDFTEATPSGEIRITIDVGFPAASAFEQGKTYYVDFTPAD